MSGYFVCVHPCEYHGEHYKRGEIIVTGDGEGPSDSAWARFEPLPGMRGTPVPVAQRELDASIELEYEIEGEDGFVLSVPRQRDLGPEIPISSGPPPIDGGKPVLDFGAGLATTSGRGLVRWVPASLRTSYTRNKDPDGFEIDWLRRGAEK